MVTDLSINRMRKYDIPEVLEIEKACFRDHSWGEKDFLNAMDNPSCFCMALTDNYLIVGYMIYEVVPSRKRVEILNLAVHPNHRRQGFGAKMFRWLVDESSANAEWIKRATVNQIKAVVRLSNTPALNFFKSLGARAYKVSSDFYEPHVNDDAVFMRYSLKSEPIPTNRFQLPYAQ